MLGRLRVRPGALALAALIALAAGCRTLAPLDRPALARLDRDLGQLLLVGFRGTTGEDNAGLERLLCVERVGGLLLFARNIVDAEQVARLTSWIHERGQACSGTRPIIAVDAEGGQVMRLGPRAGYPPTPSAHELGARGDTIVTELEARRIAQRLRAAGIDWDLAPVVDVALNPDNPVIVRTGRSYGDDPTLVAAQAAAFVRGMHEEGVLTALKHFPGHGSSFADSHLGFVDVTHTAKPAVELAPYRALIAEGYADAIMTAHVYNRRLDWRPATLSHATVARLLRRDLGWQGLVVSDDLRMGAIEQQYGLDLGAVLALYAGIDMLLVADDQLPGGVSATTVTLDAVRRALADGRLRAGRLAEAVGRVRDFKARVPSRP